MTIFISVIGRSVDFVYTWLNEESGDLTKLWLIHSPKGKTEEDNFPKIAKKLVSNLKKSYPDQFEIELKLITDPFTVDPTMDAIDDIIRKEEAKDDPPLRSEFVINITGGTNASAAASMNSANRFFTKVHYVLRFPENNSKNKRLVREIPILRESKSDFTKFQKQVLVALRDSEYFVPNTPKGIEIKITKGISTNENLLKKLGWDEKIQGKKKGSTRLTEIFRTLLAKELVEKIEYTEMYVLKEGGKKLSSEAVIDKSGGDGDLRVREDSEFYPWPLPLSKNHRSKMWKITPAGLRQSKNLFLEGE
jgi:hypothetical protein